MHSLCFHHSGQKHPAVGSSSICARTGSQPRHGTASQGFSLVLVRKRLRCDEVGEPLFLFHLPAFRICIFQPSFLFSSVVQIAALTFSPLLCWKSQSLVHQRAASPPQGGLDHGTALHFLHCCVLTLCVVIWTHPKLSASHWHPAYTGLPCPSQARGFLQVPDSDSLKNTHLHIKEIHP